MIKFPEIQDCELFLAGGCVRDQMLKIPYKDKDFVIVTDLTFDQVCDRINTMPDSKVYLAKPEFMTIRCRIQGQDIDITWPRTEEGYDDGRHPNQVQIASSLKEDALRRDFTINAMYMDAEGKIYDFFCGNLDLEDRVLRTPTDPYKTFKDDYLRIARLIRFVVTKNLSVEDRTFMAALMSVENLVDVPFERIQVELNKALLFDAERAVYWINKFNLFPIIKRKGLNLQLTAKEF